LDKGEALVLIYLIVMAVISFLPVWRKIEIGGMAMFGWLMALLMVTSPLLTLLVFRRTDRKSVGKIQSDVARRKNINSETDSTYLEPED
jgi:hypothetical protein